jgi:ribosome-binding factor A
MKPFPRSDRVSALILKELSALLKMEIQDPRLEMVTITQVKMSADLKNARIYYIGSGPKVNQASVAEGFKKAYGFIKRALAQRLGLRYMPNLKFYYDDSFDYGSRIDKLIEAAKKKDETDNSTPEEQ